MYQTFYKNIDAEILPKMNKTSEQIEPEIIKNMKV